jgi:hypothetical protein
MSQFQIQSSKEYVVGKEEATMVVSKEYLFEL